jgi:hypothetical protein
MTFRDKILDYLVVAWNENEPKNRKCGLVIGHFEVDGPIILVPNIIKGLNINKWNFCKDQEYKFSEALCLYQDTDFGFVIITPRFTATTKPTFLNHFKNLKQKKSNIDLSFGLSKDYTIIDDKPSNQNQIDARTTKKTIKSKKKPMDLFFCAVTGEFDLYKSLDKESKRAEKVQRNKIVEDEINLYFEVSKVLQSKDSINVFDNVINDLFLIGKIRNKPSCVYDDKFFKVKDWNYVISQRIHLIKDQIQVNDDLLYDIHNVLFEATKKLSKKTSTIQVSTLLLNAAFFRRVDRIEEIRISEIVFDSYDPSLVTSDARTSYKIKEFNEIIGEFWDVLSTILSLIFKSSKDLSIQDKEALENFFEHQVSSKFDSLVPLWSESEKAFLKKINQFTTKDELYLTHLNQTYSLIRFWKDDKNLGLKADLEYWIAPLNMN